MYFYTRVFIRKFPSIFEKPQNYVRPFAMQISNLAFIKLMKVLKNNLAKNDIFVISGYGQFIFIRPSQYGLIMAYRCSSVRPHLVDNISHLFPLLLIGHVVTYIVLKKGGASERCDFSQFEKRQFSYGINWFKKCSILITVLTLDN